MNGPAARRKEEEKRRTAWDGMSGRMRKRLLSRKDKPTCFGGVEEPL